MWIMVSEIGNGQLQSLWLRMYLLYMMTEKLRKIQTTSILVLNFHHSNVYYMGVLCSQIFCYFWMSKAQDFQNQKQYSCFLHLHHRLPLQFSHPFFSLSNRGQRLSGEKSYCWLILVHNTVGPDPITITTSTKHQSFLYQSHCRCLCRYPFQIMVSYSDFGTKAIVGLVQKFEIL